MMQQEIGLRAWDRWLRQMVFGFTVELYTSDSEDGELIAPRIAPNGVFETMPLMLFTGLRDKNGSKVFKGDIVRCSQGCPHVIEWHEDRGGTYFGGMPGWYLSNMNEGYAWTGTEEVIGNVFENPDLAPAADG